MISAASILEGAFGVIRNHPAAVAVWALIYLAAVAGMSLVVQPTLGTATSPEEIAANMQAMFGQLMLFQFVFFILYVAMWTASQRSVLRPAEGGIAFIRFGMDEIRMLILMIVLVVIFYFGLLMGALGVFLVAMIAYAAGGTTAAVAVGIVAGLALLCLLVWFMVRLSLAYPLTLLRGDIVIGESWRLTRGRFWPLFGAYLVIFLLVTALSLAANFATAGSYLIDMIRNMKDPVALQHVMQEQMNRQFGTITAMTVLGWVLSAAAGALTLALGGGAMATAARELTGERESVAETFA